MAAVGSCPQFGACKHCGAKRRNRSSGTLLAKMLAAPLVRHGQTTSSFSSAGPSLTGRQLLARTHAHTYTHTHTYTYTYTYAYPPMHSAIYNHSSRCQARTPRCTIERSCK
eukprot:894043-Amphidinium_carterae.1